MVKLHSSSFSLGETELSKNCEYPMMSMYFPLETSVLRETLA